LHVLTRRTRRNTMQRRDSGRRSMQCEKTWSGRASNIRNNHHHHHEKRHYNAPILSSSFFFFFFAPVCLFVCLFLLFDCCQENSSTLYFITAEFSSLFKFVFLSSLFFSLCVCVCVCWMKMDKHTGFFFSTSFNTSLLSLWRVCICMYDVCVCIRRKMSKKEQQ
jgi:hypothetical protein